MTRTSLKHTPNKMRFRNREAMLHFVASTEYTNGVIYYTDNGKTFFRNNHFYREDVCIGRVDREAEEVYLHVGMHLSGYLWHYQNQLRDAFKHFKPVEVTSFNLEEAIDIFRRHSEKVMQKNAHYQTHKGYVIAYETLKMFDVLTSKEDDKQYKKSLKFIKEVDRRKEKEQKAYEKATKDYEKECYKAIEKYIPMVLKGKDWNEKLKNFSRDGLEISLEEWKELHALSQKQPVEGRYIYKDVFSVNAPNYGRREDGTWGSITEYPAKPLLYIGQSILNGLKGLPKYADMLWIDNDIIHTTRGVTVEDKGGLVRKLLKRFVACKTDKERAKFTGLHVGSFVIREWDHEQQYLQIGCHRFYEQTLIEFADYCERK